MPSQQYCPKRVGVKNNKNRVVKSDHHPIILSLENIPRSKTKKTVTTRWNLFKTGGWDEYKKLSDEIASEADKIINDKRLSNNDVMKKFDSLQTKIKYKAFGKTKPITKKSL